MHAIYIYIYAIYIHAIKNRYFNMNITTYILENSATHP